jgi:glucosamine 6-phosphate synthetase-like amidotransferase/phosphosugar isomerase protein
VLCFDAGHWGLLANHVPFAVASGIPTSTIRALRDGKEDKLSAADRQVVAFIRATRDGTITDEMWSAMVKRMGSERGVVEFMYFTLHLLMHVRLIQAFDEVQILPHELEDLLTKLEKGQYPLPAVAHAGPPETKPVPAHP